MTKDPPPRKASADKTKKAPSPRPSPPERGEGERVVPGKHRLKQVARTGERKLFDATRRELFLEWFAATCNVKLSAEKAGVCYQTVFKHRMKDEAFAEAWDQALAQGYAYLEARLLEEVIGPPATAEPPHPGPHPDGEREQIAVEAEAAFDPQLAITLLREHARRLPSSADKRKHQRTTARVATNEEVRAALVKRLKAFGVRVGKNPPRNGEVAVAPATDGGGPLHHPSDGPPPRSGEE